MERTKWTATMLAAVMLASVASASREEPGVWTARAAVGEVWFEASDDAYAAIAEVHVRRARARGWSTTRVARAYSAAVRGARRPWVAALNTDEGRPPPGWPRVPWAPRARRFAHVLGVVRSVFAGERPEVCPEATHYGSVADGPPEGGLERWELACAPEGTSQRFWRRR